MEFNDIELQDNLTINPRRGLHRISILILLGSFHRLLPIKFQAKFILKAKVLKDPVPIIVLVNKHPLRPNNNPRLDIINVTKRPHFNIKRNNLQKRSSISFNDRPPKSSQQMDQNQYEGAGTQSC
jgi:hypothetical protein